MAMAKIAKQSLVVTVTQGCHINDVARDLKAAGLEVEGVLNAIGVVTGKAPREERCATAEGPRGS
jgi:hypothetical protein